MEITKMSTNIFCLKSKMLFIILALSIFLFAGCSTSSPYKEITSKSEYYYKHNTFTFDLEEDTAPYFVTAYIKYESTKGKTYFLDVKLKDPTKRVKVNRIQLEDKDITLFTFNPVAGTYTLTLDEQEGSPVPGSQIFIHVYKILNSTSKNPQNP